MICIVKIADVLNCNRQVGTDFRYVSRHVFIMRCMVATSLSEYVAWCAAWPIKCDVGDLVSSN